MNAAKVGSATATLGPVIGSPPGEPGDRLPVAAGSDVPYRSDRSTAPLAELVTRCA